jgi:hypothetical protein
MCDYSLHNVKTRPAKVGDKLVTNEFAYTLTRGFASTEDLDVAVCLLPGTELSFSDDVSRMRMWPWSKTVIQHKTAIFRQVNLANPNAHHDALEFPDGQIVLLTTLKAGQQATVLQLPATAVAKLPQPLTYAPLPTSQ